MIDLLITVVVAFVAVSSATSLIYSVAVLAGGGGAGQENELITQIWLGLAGLLIVHASGVLW